jgi:hypothetical protein
MKKGIITVLLTVTGVAAGAISTNLAAKKRIAQVQQYSSKHMSLYLLMNQWVKVKQADKDISEYLIKQGYRRIAIYGMNYVGQTLYEELKDTEITISYAIDKNADGILVPVDVLFPDDDLPEVDAVVVTAITFFDEIEEQLAGKMDCPIMSLEDLLYEV